MRPIFVLLHRWVGLATAEPRLRVAVTGVIIWAKKRKGRLARRQLRSLTRDIAA